jgi:plastocyanin
VTLARLARLTALTAALLVLSTQVAVGAPARAVIVDVTIQNFVFSPATVTIDRGDTIRWTNLDSAPHSAVTVTPGFVTAVLGQAQVTTTLFESGGTFEYICGVHGASMRGVVTVRGPVAPTERPTATPAGHIVVAQFQEARPDFPDGLPSSAPSVWLYASVALAAIVLARALWMLRHWPA